MIKLLKIKKYRIPFLIKVSFICAFLQLFFIHTYLHANIPENQDKIYDSLKIELNKQKISSLKVVTFIELLKSLSKIRISRGLSQKDLGDLIGVPKQQINRYEEHEYQNISIEKINIILEVLNINLDLIPKKEIKVA